MSAAKKMVETNDEMDMTPMIDIVFNLLIFFMVVSDLTNKDLANLTLPLAYTSEQDKGKEPDERIILNIDREGQLLFKGVPISLKQLGVVLRQLKDSYDYRTKGEGFIEIGGQKASKLYVLLRADKDTPWQHVQWVMTVMAEERLFRLQFATKQTVDGRYLKALDKRNQPRSEVEAVGGMTQDEFKEWTEKRKGGS